MSSSRTTPFHILDLWPVLPPYEEIFRIIVAAADVVEVVVVVVKKFFFILAYEAIGTAATPGLLCQPRVIMKMIVEK
jgi:hypothetical protein